MAGLRLGVLGGTFDPVHLGHLILGETAREQLRLNRVLFVPVGQPWRKAGRSVAPAEHRLAMLGLAIAENPAFEASTLEVLRRGPTYTADTLEALRAEYAKVELVLILGADALADLPNWHEPERIAELATLAVARRWEEGPRRRKAVPLKGLEQMVALVPGLRRELGALEARMPGLARQVVWLEMPRIEISASAIRERARRGLSVRYLVPEKVEAYIREHGLYCA